MSVENWKQGGAFGNFKKRIQHISDLIEKAAKVQANMIEEKVEHINKVQKQVEVANMVRDMGKEDLKGRVISDELD